jgi:hypothetical protein
MNTGGSSGVGSWNVSRQSERNETFELALVSQAAWAKSQYHMKSLLPNYLHLLIVDE